LKRLNQGRQTFECHASTDAAFQNLLSRDELADLRPRPLHEQSRLPDRSIYVGEPHPPTMVGAADQLHEVLGFEDSERLSHGRPGKAELFHQRRFGWH
jgi:hypothetical protein